MRNQTKTRRPTISIAAVALLVVFAFPLQAQEPPNNQEPLIGDALVPHDLRWGGGIGPASYSSETSLVMIGKVAVQLIILESDGSIDPETETWTMSNKSLIQDEIQAAFNWWETRAAESDVPLEFVYREPSAADPGNTWVTTVEIGYEPINRSKSDHPTWIGAAMTALGFTGDHITASRAYVRDLIDELDADWGFIVFAVDSANDPDGKFADGSVAWGYLGGPYQVLTLDGGNYGKWNTDQVVAHETGHIFGALDQYTSAGVGCTEKGGYLQIENQNSDAGSCLLNEPSIMKQAWIAYPANSVDVYARGQVGWWDGDGNGIPDLLEGSPPTLTVSRTIETFSGQATASGSPFISATITNVQYRLDGGAWQTATPKDSAFDESSEDFSFSVPNPIEGTTRTLDVMATNSQGMTTTVTLSVSHTFGVWLSVVMVG